MHSTAIAMKRYWLPSLFLAGLMPLAAPTHAADAEVLLDPSRAGPTFEGIGAVSVKASSWLLKEARKRNPKIILDCLAWGEPGWIGNGRFWLQDGADYGASYFDSFTAPQSGVITANSPWCGAFTVLPELWAVAHTTQFVREKDLRALEGVFTLTVDTNAIDSHGLAGLGCGLHPARFDNLAVTGRPGSYAEPCPPVFRSLTPLSRRAAHGLPIALSCVLLPSALSAGPQDFLPPVLPWHGSSQALVAKPDDPWITPSEKTGLTDTPSYDETIAYLMRLTNASPLVALREFGRTAQGRSLYVVIASQDRGGTPKADRATGKPALLAQAGIHAGEIDGKDAGLMLLRDIAVGGKAALLDGADFLFVPVVNPDGHERISEWNRPNQRGPIHPGWRTSAQNLNLNRDYMKADTPEMEALLTLINQWSPSLYLDLHVTDGIDYQYDITFGYHGDNGVSAWSPQIGAWLNRTYRPEAEAALKAAGHIPGPLVFERDERDLSQGFAAPVSMPRYSHGYGDLRHLPSVLVENHSLKPYRQRVLGTYVLIESSLRTLAAHAPELQQAVDADRSAARPTLPMNWTLGGGEQITRDFLGIAYETYTSPATGGTEVRWLGTPKLYPRLPVFLPKPGVELIRPKAYWVPGAKAEVIARLKLHGIRMDVLPTAQRVRVEMYRLVDPQPQPGQGSHPFEGRHTLKTSVKAETRTETFPPGSVRVPTDQPLGDLAVALLEPESNDSFFAWGFFLETLQRAEYIEGYALAPMADRMLATEPKLKAEFEAKIASDEKFFKDPAARRRWFYERSPGYDDRYLLYPVGIGR